MDTAATLDASRKKEGKRTIHLCVYGIGIYETMATSWQVNQCISTTRPEITRTQGGMRAPAKLAAHVAIRFYQLTFSALVGRQCRHVPSCSEYTDQAIQRHGIWAGGWMGLARICRCRPFGTSGYDPILDPLPARARWYLPWRYGLWYRIAACQR